MKTCHVEAHVSLTFKSGIGSVCSAKASSHLVVSADLPEVEDVSATNLRSRDGVAVKRILVDCLGLIVPSQLCVRLR